LQLRGKLRDGELKSGKPFRDAAKLYLREFDIMTQGQRNATYARGQHARTHGHLVPFFGSVVLARGVQAALRSDSKAGTAPEAATGQTILEIEVRGKRGIGFCKSTVGAMRPFERLKARLRPEGGPGSAGSRKDSLESGEWQKPGATELLFPKWSRDLFNAILEEEKLRVDRDGRPRTAYSLRHTYICLRLLEGADIYQIAKNCRTSVEMIEKYYAAHLKTQLDASAINVMKPRPKRELARKEPRRVETHSLADAM
jgi:hypothetical protein